MFESLLVRKDTKIPEGTKATLKTLGAEKLYAIKNDNNITAEFNAVLQVVQRLGEFLRAIDINTDPSNNYDDLKSLIATGYPADADAPALRFSAISDFLRSRVVTAEVFDFQGIEDE
jgi:hypothetical protein